MIAGLLLFFWVLGVVIEMPERAIRWLIANLKKKTPPLPPQHHNDFDDAV